MHARTSPRRTAAILAGSLLLLGTAAVPPAQADTTQSRVLVKVVDAASVADALTQTVALGGTVLSVFDAVDAYAASVPADQIDAIRGLPGVAAVQEDAPVSVAATSQPSAPWGLDRVDQRALPFSSTYTYDTTGAGVDVYILDTGVYAEHPEFGGRVATGVDFTGEGAGDGNGHGTHAAGIVAASTWGAAKGARIIPVKVLGADGTGTIFGVLSGLSWVVENRLPGVPAVVNLSLDASTVDTVLNAVVKEATDAGITVVVAAGNNGSNACLTSPASAPTAITVAATDATDARTSWSNYGTCVDLFAPGNQIMSTWKPIDGNPNSARLDSGTSMSSPLVAGLAARYLQLNPTASPAQVQTALKAAATPGVVSNSLSSAGLAYMGLTVTVSTFRAPVDLAPVRNSAQAGRTLPFGFIVTDGAGAPITGLTTADVSVVSAMTSTCTSAPTDLIEAYAASTSTGQLVDLGGGSYQYNVKTSKSWAGQCGPLGVTVLGTARTAEFAFKA